MLIRENTEIAVIGAGVVGLTIALELVEAGRDVVLVSSADETAFEVRRVLSDLGLARPATGADASGRASCGRAEFITTGDVDWFEELGRRLLGPELDRAEKLSW